MSNFRFWSPLPGAWRLRAASGTAKQGHRHLSLPCKLRLAKSRCAQGALVAGCARLCSACTLASPDSPSVEAVYRPA